MNTMDGVLEVLENWDFQYSITPPSITASVAVFDRMRIADSDCGLEQRIMDSLHRALRCSGFAPFILPFEGQR
jgi:hypothetical protein